MKKTKSGKSGSSAKGRGSAKSVEEYLAAVPEPARSTLERVRAAVRSAAPKGSVEVISYGIPAFKHTAVLIWYAAFAKHCSLFPTGAIIEKFKSDLKNYTISKGTIQFPLNKPLPTSLVKRMVKARIAQIDKKKQRGK